MGAGCGFERTDESTRTRRGKPKGVHGAEVWLALAALAAPQLARAPSP